MLCMFLFIFARKGAVTTYIDYVRLINHMHLMVDAAWFNHRLRSTENYVSIDDYQIAQHNRNLNIINT